MKKIIFIAAIALAGCGQSQLQKETEYKLDSLERYKSYREANFKLQEAGSPIKDEVIDSIWTYNEYIRNKIK